MPDEGESMVNVANSMYFNVGTILPIYGETLPKTAKCLAEKEINWVLDPVAIGMGELRQKILMKFKNYRPGIVRGNASEIIALAGLWDLDGGTDKPTNKGVDSTDEVGNAMKAAISVAKFINGAVSVSGEVDLVTDGNIVARSYGGSAYLSKITGAGCALGGVSAVYAACADPFTAALTAVNVFNLAGERAEKLCKGPGSFQAEFLDQLYLASPEDISSVRMDMEIVN